MRAYQRTIGAALLAVVWTGMARGQDADRLTALIAAATRYATEYEARFSAVVCEERQTQRVVAADGRTRKQRELVSDFLLVKVGDRTLGFRDVSAVDGKRLADRKARLEKLFLQSTGRSPLLQAAAIVRESARYNIGFERDFDGLMVPLLILSHRYANGFVFTSAPEGLRFSEITSPTIVQFRDPLSTRDLPVHGRLSVDAPSGRLLSASVTAENPVFEVTVDIRYAEDPTIGLLVPTDAQEHYRITTKPKADRLEVASTYGVFRRFQVTVDERFDR